MSNSENYHRLARFCTELAAAYKRAEQTGAVFHVEVQRSPGTPYYENTTPGPMIAYFDLDASYRIVWRPRKFWANIYDNLLPLALYHTALDADAKAGPGRTALICLVEDTTLTEHFSPDPDEVPLY